MGIRRVFGGKSVELESLPAELKGMLEDMRRERSAFEADLVRAGETLRSAEQLSASVAQAQKAAEQLTGQLAAVERVGERLQALQAQADALAAGSRESGESLEGMRRLVEQARAEAEALGPRLDAVSGLKGDLPVILEKAEAIRGVDALVRTAATSLEEVRGRQEELVKGVAEATARLEGVEPRLARQAAAVDGLGMRVDTFAKTVAEIKQMMGEAPNVKRELGTLRAMAEFASQKVAALEGQRDAVERATRRAEGLTELMTQVERQYAEQQTNAKFLEQLEERVHKLKGLHESVLEQAQEVHRRQGELDALGKAQLEAFEGARGSVHDAVAGFAFEREGLKAMSVRVQELRDALSAVEGRLPALEGARAGLADAESAAERLGARVAALHEQVAEAEAAAAALGPVREEIRVAQTQAQELTRRVESTSPPALAALDDAERRVAALGEALEGLERRAAQVEGLRAGLTEMAREINGRQSALDGALAQLERAGGLHAETAEVAGRLERESEALRARLAEAGAAASRAEGQLAEFEERWRQVADVGARLGTLERRVGEVLEAEQRLDRAHAQLDGRRASLDAVREDLGRLTGIADATVGKVQGIAALQKEVEQRHATVEEMAGRLRQLDRFAEQLDARAVQFAEAERHLQLLDAHLSDMKATLGLVMEQRSFLERVVETSGTLSFQMMQAESLLQQLREERGEGAPATGRTSGGRTTKGGD